MGATAGAMIALLIIGGAKSWSNGKGPKAVVAPGAASPGGHYSQAMINGDMVHISGLLTVMPDGTKLNADPMEAQVKKMLYNLGEILKASRSSPDKLISVRVYLANFSHEN